MNHERIKYRAQLMLAIGAGSNFGLWQQNVNAGLFVFCVIGLIILWIQP